MELEGVDVGLAPPALLLLAETTALDGSSLVGLASGWIPRIGDARRLVE